MPDAEPDKSTFAITLANNSYEWYRSHAIRARKSDRVNEIAILATSATIPVAASISPHNAIAPAVLGGVTVILAGMRTIFHWHESYLRFSRAREAIEHERRLYYVEASPYVDPATREKLLTQAVSRIEQEEMGSWVRIASERPGQSR